MGENKKLGLSIVVPVYNEQTVTQNTVRQLLKVKEEANFEVFYP